MTRVTVGDLPRINTNRCSEAAAYVDATGPWSWAEVDDRVSGWCQLLAGGCGLKAGETFAVLSDNRADCLFLLFASSRQGLVHMSLNMRGSDMELAAQLIDGGARVLVVSPEYEGRAQTLAVSGGGLSVVVMPGREPGDLPPADGGQVGEPAGDPEAVYNLVYTSGSSGQPKGVAISNRNELHDSWGFVWATHRTATDRLLHCLPMYHRGGQLVAVSYALSGQGMVMVEPKAESILEALGVHQCSEVLLVPTLLKLMLEAYEQSGRSYDLGSLRRICIGSAHLPVDLAIETAATLPGIQLAQLGGMSEGLSTAITPAEYAERLADPAKVGPLHSSGRALPGVRIRIVDDDDAEVEDGVVGELTYQSDGYVDGYWRKPDVSAHAWRGGWFHSGDLGYRDSEGYIYYKDRMFGRIRSGSETVFAREVETVLARHEGVTEVAVVGVPHDLWGEMVVAVVVAKDASDPGLAASLSSMVRWEIAAYKVPKEWVYVDELPRTSLGKPAYGEIRKLAIAGVLTSSPPATH